MLKIFKKEKKDAENIDSWIFHEDIKVVFRRNYCKRLKKRMRVLLGLYSLLVLLLFALLSMRYESMTKAALVTLCCMAIGALGIPLESLALWLWKRRAVRKYWPLVVFPLAALAVVIVLIIIYPDQSRSLHRTDILGFSGDFLSFLGTFCLGYFIYIQDRARETAKKREKIRLLYELMETANTELLRLSRLVEDKDYIKIQKNRDRVELITYDPNWRLYYTDYESVEGVNYDLQKTLKNYFQNISDVNAAIKTGQLETAVKLNETHIIYEKYSTQKYNSTDAAFCLLDACNDYHIINTKSWIERQENIDLVNKLCKRYYYVIENYIYAWLLKHHVDSTERSFDLQREAADWLLINSPGIEEEMGLLDRERIMMQVILDCSKKFKEKSKKIDYVWAEYQLK